MCTPGMHHRFAVGAASRKLAAHGRLHAIRDEGAPALGHAMRRQAKAVGGGFTPAQIPLLRTPHRWTIADHATSKVDAPAHNKRSETSVRARTFSHTAHEGRRM